MTFTAGQTVATVSVSITDDNIVEDTEMFTATLSTTDSNVMFGEDTASITVLDDDGKDNIDTIASERSGVECARVEIYAHCEITITRI